jgi:hypothetical protein
MIGKIRYAASEIIENYDDTRWWKQRLTHRVIGGVHSVYPGYDDAVHVMDEDWDNLLVLDACRYDLFEEVVDVDRFDDYRRVQSLGSATPEWTKKNFAGRSFGDTTYVSGNPQTTKHAPDSFHHLEEVWKDAFDDELRTVLPDAVASGLRGAHEQYPDKRLVGHFMQPHRPFVGSEDLFFGGMYNPDRVLDEERDNTDDRTGPRDPWMALEAGETSLDRLWESYRENLEIAMDEVWSLVEDLDGRTVITSDHGNLIGERGWPIPMKLYGHPTNVRLDGLVTVPWAVIDGKRRDITDEGTHYDTTDSETIEQRLQDLGYK